MLLHVCEHMNPPVHPDSHSRIPSSSMSTPSITSDHLTTKHFSTVGLSNQKHLSNNEKKNQISYIRCLRFSKTRFFAILVFFFFQENSFSVDTMCFHLHTFIYLGGKSLIKPSPYILGSKNTVMSYIWMKVATDLPGGFHSSPGTPCPRFCECGGKPDNQDPAVIGFTFYCRKRWVKSNRISINIR